MRKAGYCELCGSDAGFEGHLMFLAMLHLEIEHFPKENFDEEEVFEKSQSLIGMVQHENIHLNLSYALTQLEKREKEENKIRLKS